MKINKYAVIYKGYILTHFKFKMIEISYNTGIKEPQYEIDEENTLIKLQINPNNEFIDNDIIYRVDENAPTIEEGRYELYNLYTLNNNYYVISRLLYENTFCIYYIDESILPHDMIKQIPNKKISSRGNEIGDNTYAILLRGGYFPQKDIKTGITEQKIKDEELIDFLKRSNIIYPLDDTIEKGNFNLIRCNLNRTNFISKDKTIYRKENDDIYLSGPHYANLVINTLREAYPEVHFFNTSSDWMKEKDFLPFTDKGGNKKDYREFIRYNIGAEDYSRARREFHSNFGPIILGTKLEIEFEYITTETDLFLKRRTDFFLDQFISYYTHDHFNLNADLLGDNSKITGFSINWQKDESYTLDLARDKNTVALDNLQLEMHSFRFRAELFFRVLRFNFQTPPILKILINFIDREGTKEQIITVKEEATEEEKKYIKKVYDNGGYLKEGQLEAAMKGENIENKEPEKEENVEIVNPEMKD